MYRGHHLTEDVKELGEAESRAKSAPSAANALEELPAGCGPGGGRPDPHRGGGRAASEARRRRGTLALSAACVQALRV